MGVNYGRSQPEHMGGTYRFQFPKMNTDLRDRIAEAHKQRMEYLMGAEGEGDQEGAPSPQDGEDPSRDEGDSSGRSSRRMAFTPRQRQRQQQRDERRRILASGPAKDPVWGDDVHPGSYSHWKASGGSEEGWNQYMQDLRTGKAEPIIIQPQQQSGSDPNAGWGEPEDQTPSQPSGPPKVPSLFGGEHAPASGAVRRINKAQKAVGIVANKAQKVKREVDAQKAAKQAVAQKQADEQAAQDAAPDWLK